MKVPYTMHFDTLVALLTHLSATDRASRTPTYVANDLGLSKEEVLQVLEGFPAFFRKSRKTSNIAESKGDHFYTVHLRYSRRKLDNEEDGESQPLSTDEIDILLNLVSHMVTQEQENSRVVMELKENYKNLQATNKVTMIAAIIAAISAVIAAFVGSNY